MKTDYKLWQEREGNLVPQVEKPEPPPFEDSYYTELFMQEMKNWEAASQVSLPIIGDIEKVRGRVLELNKDFRIDNISFADDGTQVSNNSDLAVSFKTVAVLIDNQQQDATKIAAVSVRKNLINYLEEFIELKGNAHTTDQYNLAFELLESLK